jgi:Enoyl-(Acyl carrier protein) reductase
VSAAASAQYRAPQWPRSISTRRLRYILGHYGVWNTTADDIAEYYIANYSTRCRRGLLKTSNRYKPNGSEAARQGRTGHRLEPRRLANQEYFDDYVRHGFPMGRLGTAEEVADVIAFLASPRVHCINGRNIPVDGLEQPHAPLDRPPF